MSFTHLLMALALAPFVIILLWLCVVAVFVAICAILGGLATAFDKILRHIRKARK